MLNQEQRIPACTMKFNLFAISLVMALVSPLSGGAVVIRMQESGDDVVAAYSGTLDTSGLSDSSQHVARHLINPGQGHFINATEFPNWRALDVFSSAPILGSNSISSATFFSGDTFGIWTTNFLVGDESVNGDLILPEGWRSGDSVSGSMRWAGESFASLGFDETGGPYTWTLNGSGDTITLSVPEPSAVVCCLLAMIGLCLTRRR